ncbi:MAG: hypothetical protein CBC13_05265 [Planctomycetia bacterium TMED53]|nr:MAG: hypothetical protein CBC13_05265 [Planctomycetia bacterium TMED53]
MWAELLQILLSILLILIGLHRTILLWESRYRPLSISPDPADNALELESSLPVLIQIPVFNDSDALVGMLPQLPQFNASRFKFEIQILDDSDDGSAPQNRSAVEQLALTGLPIRYIHRDRRKGYKAGALAEGLALSEAQFIAIFDVDFQIPADFLSRTLHHFSDPQIGWVQCRWGFTNRNHNWLTRAQARLLDGHFRVEHRARAAAGRFFNFNGTAGIWRRQAIEDAGGWNGDTIVEDTDLSLRAWNRGWRAVYRDDIVCCGLLPDHFSAFRTQQRRWFAGGMQLSLREITGAGAVDSTKLSLLERFDLSARFFAPLGSIVVVLLTLWAPLRRIFPQFLGPDPWVFKWLGTPHFEGIFLFFACLSLILYYSATGGGLLARLWESLLVLILGTGFALYAAISCCAGLLGQVTTFERTPKARSSTGGRGVTGWEILWAPLLLLLWGGAYQSGAWSVLPLVSMSLVGLLWSFSGKSAS